MNHIDLENQPVPQVGVGIRLRAAREAAGITIPELAARLHVLARIVEDIESEHFERLGARVYVRGHLRSYAREVGLPWREIEPLAADPVSCPPELVCMAPTPRWKAQLELLGHRSVYLILTIAIVAPIVWLASHRQLPDLAAPVSLSANAVADSGAVPASIDAQTTAVQRPQLAPASLALRLPSAPATEAWTESEADFQPASGGEWRFVFSEDSWFELYAPDGRRVEHRLVKAGEALDFSAALVGRVALGNASAVRVSHGEESIDLAAFLSGNVARFEITAGGEPVPRFGDG